MRLHNAGEPVSCLSRKAGPENIASYIADLDQPPFSLPEISGRLVYSVPPPSKGVKDTRLNTFLSGLGGEIECFVYLSTSGVYGDCDGDWVDETREPAPKTDRARRRLDAEMQLRAWADARKVRLVILRVPGIYGPGRLPVQRLQARTPIMDPALAPWSNRIHAEDLAQACCLALQRGQGVYNISDGCPSSMSEYFLRCAQHLGLPAPPSLNREQARKTFSPQLMSYYRESRRMKIDKARQELGFAPAYPDLTSGLAHC